ncbi:hypothetical protein OXX69_006909 [Metschnikowia pulcherrima]
MLLARKKVLSPVSNFSAYEAAVRLLAMESPLTHTEFCFLPPNSTSMTQPLNQGIIQAFKCKYCKLWLKYMVEEIDEERDSIKTVNVMKSVKCSIEAWNSITTATMANCWRHASLSTAPEIPILDVSHAEVCKWVSRLLR